MTFILPNESCQTHKEHLRVKLSVVMFAAFSRAASILHRSLLAATKYLTNYPIITYIRNSIYQISQSAFDLRHLVGFWFIVTHQTRIVEIPTLGSVLAGIPKTSVYVGLQHLPYAKYHNTIDIY